MVSWGMGHNLEKNLERVQTLRAKGQLDRALKSLQDWAEKHPDTPHYQFEAAMVAFELSDWSTGLGALRALVRSLPETREKVLGACREQFDEVGALPLADFLIEHALRDEDLATATELVDRLDEENRGVFLRKLAMRQRSLTTSGGVPTAKELHGLTVQFLLACSLLDGERVRDCIPDLVGGSGFAAFEWTKLIDKALKLAPQNTDLLIARAHSLAAEKKIDAAGESLIRAARIREPEIDNCLSLLQSIQPEDDTRGAWYHTEGHLYLLQQDGTRAARSWRRAADADPKLREQLLEGLARPSENSALPGREEALKLRLRLLVVQKHFDEIPELARRLVADGLADPGELRALLGEGGDNDLPNEMTAVLAEIALRDGDIVAAAKFAYDIPTSDDHSCRRLLRAIDSLMDDWDEESRLQLCALRAVLRARINDRNGANAALAEAWIEFPTEIETLTAVSARCLENIEPLPEFVCAAMAALLDADSTDWLKAPFLSLCPTQADLASVYTNRAGGLNFVGGNPGGFSQNALDLDLGGADSEDFASEIKPAILSLLRENPERGSAFIRFFDGLERPDLEPSLRHSLALAALLAGDIDRALPTFALLTMMATQEFLTETARDFDAALENNAEHVDLILMRGDLHIELGELEPAAELLDRALRLAPDRADDVVECFDRMLALANEDTAPRLQKSLGEALFEVQRFDRLEDLCDQAIRSTEGSDQVPFLRLKIRMATARGDFSGAMQQTQQFTVQGPMPAKTGAELLEEILAINPGSAICWLMLGQLASRAGMLPRALEAYIEAIRVDPGLEAPVAEQIHEMGASADADTKLLIGVGRFHLGRKAPDRAAYALSRALDVEAASADRVLGELESSLGSGEPDLDLLAVGARACRLADKPERAAQMLLQVESRESSRLETVLAELRNLRQDYPDLILPAISMAEVLWRQNSAEAANRIVIEAAAVDAYPLDARVAMLRDFHGRSEANTLLALSLADLLAERGDRAEACELIESCRDKDGFEAERATEVTGRLHRKYPEHAGLAIQHHDLLVRSGRILEALRTLPSAGVYDAGQLDEITRRFEEYRPQVVADSDLALHYSDCLVHEDRIADAIAILDEAAAHESLPGQHPLLLEWARLLHRHGDPGRSAAVLREHFRDNESQRKAFSSFGRWNAERTDTRLDALRGRLDENPEDLDCALEIARTLLSVERAAEAREILAPLTGDVEFEPRRAVLLGRAHLQLKRAEDAAAVLLDAVGAIAPDHEHFGEIQYRLAECADRLGRPDEACARLRGLLSNPRYSEQARARVRSSYAHHLSEAACERRAVLTAVSSLQSNPSRSIR